MALPKQVRDQIKEADRIADEIEKALEAEEKQPEEDNVVQLAEEPEEKVEQEEEKPEPAAEEKPEPKPESQPADDWQHKYEVLQGKYNAEVPRQSREIRDLKSKVEEMSNLVAALKEPKEPEAPATPQNFVTPEEVEEYGADLVDLVGRRAKEVYTPEIDKLNKQIQNLQNELQTVRRDVGSTSQNQFLSQLDRQVENWRTINTDPKFLDWLDVLDDFSGKQRGDLLREAYNRGDSDRVAFFFKRYLNEHAVSNDPQPQPAEDTAKVGMDQLVAPGKPKAQQPADAPQGKRIWTQKEISDFYLAVQKGKYRNNMDEKNKIERQIHTAVNEGRIR